MGSQGEVSWEVEKRVNDGRVRRASSSCASLERRLAFCICLSLAPSVDWLSDGFKRNTLSAAHFSPKSFQQLRRVASSASTYNVVVLPLQHRLRHTSCNAAVGSIIRQILIAYMPVSKWLKKINLRLAVLQRMRAIPSAVLTAAVLSVRHTPVLCQYEWR